VLGAKFLYVFVDEALCVAYFVPNFFFGFCIYVHIYFCRLLTWLFWYAVTAMNSVSGNLRVVQLPTFSREFMSLARTTWNRGWYLRIEFRTVCEMKI
jgi:hypothetical protein